MRPPPAFSSLVSYDESIAPSMSFAHCESSVLYMSVVGGIQHTQSSRVRYTGGLARDISSCSTSKSKDHVITSSLKPPM